MPLNQKPPVNPALSSKLKLLTRNIEYPESGSAIDYYRAQQSKAHLTIQRTSFMLIMASLVAVSVALTLHFAEHGGFIADIIRSSLAAQTLLLSTLGLCVMSYYRRLHMRFFSAGLIFAVVSLYFHETQLLTSIATALNLPLDHDGIRISCVLFIVLIGYTAHRIRKLATKTNVSFLLVPSTRVFIIYFLPFLALLTLIAKASLERILDLENGALIEQILLRHAYALLLLASLIDVFTLNQSNLRYAKEVRPNGCI